MDRVDVLVVGAGLVGLGVAWGLLDRGLSVAVVDVDRPGAGASGVAAGMLAPLCEAPDMPEPLLRMAVRSAEVWPAFARDLETAAGRSVDLRDDGTLLAAVDHDELAQLDQSARVLERQGLRLKPLAARELRRLAPALSPRVIGGFQAPLDHGVDAQAVVAALVAALAARGTSVRRARGVRDGTIVVDGAEIRAQRVVVAAGAWSTALAPSVRLVPVKGQVVLLRGEALLPCTVRTPRVYLVPRAEGRLVVGASMEEQGFDVQSTAGVVMDLLREAWRTLPGSYELAIEDLRTGLRPMLADGMPALGPVDDVVVAVGHHRHGVLLLPETIRRVVGSLVDDAPWDPDLLPTRPGLR